MARYPGTTWRPLPEANQQPTIRPTQVILHIAVSEASSLYGYWTSPGVGLESHFYLRRDGGGEQYVDSERSADANLLANRRPDGTGALSVETQGGVGADVNGRWSGPQVDRIIDLIRWANRTHGIPLRLCRTADDPGIAWHVQFGAPGPWTNARGKVCPGPGRVQQIQDTIMPRLLGGIGPIQEDFMAGLTEDEQREALVILRDLRKQFDPANTAGIVSKLNRTGANLSLLLDDEGNIKAGVDTATTAILEGLKTLPTAALPDETIAQLAAAIGQAAPQVNADAIITALRDRISDRPAT